MKILEVCPFSAGICGVWARVYAESREFVRLGYEVRVFSSNIEKGSGNLAVCDEDMEGVSVKRFGAKSSFISKNVHSFDFEQEFMEYKPDVVVTHLLHPHSFKALALAKKAGVPCYLVTHAPFNVKRIFPLNLATAFYNSLKVKPKLRDFTKIIAVTKWEIPYLLRFGVGKNKIFYIPNGIPNEFFSQKKVKPAKGRVLFLGRIAPVKNIETLVLAAKMLPDVSFSLVGSAEKDYLAKMERMIEKIGIKNLKIFPPIYDLKKKIAVIDEHKVFVLPSSREAMPQVLLEAMARGKVVISSNTDGGKEIITDKKDGLLFKIGDYKQLADLIKKNVKGNKKIQNAAERGAKRYSWNKLINSYVGLFNAAGLVKK